MPISAIGDCEAGHWIEVKDIIDSAIERAGCTPILVSEAQDVGIIQDRIVQNLYSNPIVVCDISHRNANVMFELGMRLAFDKPTIVIKDDKTVAPFDTGPLEYIEYPRDLRFSAINTFSERLSEKLEATLEKPKNKRSSFLSAFGQLKSVKLESTDVSASEFLIEEMKLLRSEVARLRDNSPGRPRRRLKEESLCLGTMGKDNALKMTRRIECMQGVETADLRHLGGQHFHIDVKYSLSSQRLRDMAGQKVNEELNNFRKELKSASEG